MKDLLTNYSTSDIVLFVVFLVVAIKEAVQLYDWAKERTKKVFDKDYHAQEEREELREEIQDLNKFYNEKKVVDDGFEKINQAIAKINELIEMLITSDKESIKSYITEKHHYYVYEKKWIDDYSMDCLEKRYAIYQKEHGNSFAADLMQDLRGLPRIPPEL